MLLASGPFSFGFTGAVFLVIAMIVSSSTDHAALAVAALRWIAYLNVLLALVRACEAFSAWFLHC